MKKTLEIIWDKTSQEKTDLLEQAVSYLERHSTITWAHSFLKDLKRAHEPTNLSYFMGATYNPSKRRLIIGNHNFIHLDEKV